MSTIRVLFAASMLMSLCGAAASAQSSLAVRLERVLEGRELRGSSVGALVVRQNDGQVVYAHGADRALIPASNMKILTAMAALDAFGPSHQFETVVLAAGAPDVSGAVQDLAVKGGGDPVMNSEDWWRLAADLRRSGLRAVRGDLIVDDSIFDREYWHSDWGKVSSRAYHAPVGGLTANYGAYFVRVQPGAQPRDPVRIDVDPPVPYLAVSNRATTGSRTAKRSLSVGHGVGPAGRETVEVSGTVRAGDDADLFPRSVRDAALYAGSVLKMQLEANGISVAGRVRRASGPLPAHELLRFEGRPLSEIVRLFMKYSNNSIGESLIKSIGARTTGEAGGWQSGLAAAKHRLEALGLSDPALVMADGSGLSPLNRITPRLLVDSLRRARETFGFGPELMASLPIAARDGTLEKRTRAAKDRVRGKTGLLSDQRATALSGFAERPGGDLVVYSIIVNGYTAGSRGAMDGIDRWVAELVR
jgi:D-alanyl-D-alanine carboxypeptidase/D-alanyl-D-alanine-endopeptidase (penicillin-binding protein 4)